MLRKYGYKELIGICKDCLFGCGRLEDINFNGIYRCKNYIGGTVNGNDSGRNTKNNETVLRRNR